MAGTKRHFEQGHKLFDASQSADVVFANIGDLIEVDADSGFLRGHGTQVQDGKLTATVCGVVDRVNKLVSVRPLKARYHAETGDVVVGRIVEVVQNKWRVEIHASQHANLMLSAVNLPGGIQRRRTAVDELNMRDHFRENDLISAEVQAIHQDGAVSLHTRSLKYGKLEGGQLVQVPPYLVKRVKQHFVALEGCQVGLILGCNGFIWVGAPGEAAADGRAAQDASGGAVQPGEPMEEERPNEEVARTAQEVPLDLRRRICQVANAIRVLKSIGLTISPQSIEETYAAADARGVSIKDMLAHSFLKHIMDQEVKRRKPRK